MKMTFGKYKGKELSEVMKEDDGSSYVFWLLTNEKSPLNSKDVRFHRLNVQMKTEIESLLNASKNPVVQQAKKPKPTNREEAIRATSPSEIVNHLQRIEKKIDSLQAFLMTDPVKEPQTYCGQDTKPLEP